jgi:hypothetical protein
MYGGGQGFNEGVRTAAGFLFKGMQMKRDDKRFHDRLALDQAWKDGFYGGPSLLDVNAGEKTYGQPGGRMSSPGDGRWPSHPASGTTPTSGESLAGLMPDPVNHAPTRSFLDPMNPSPVRPMVKQPTPSQGNPDFRQPNLIRPTTPLSPIWMMRRGFRRGY